MIIYHEEAIMNPKTFHIFLYCLTLFVILIQFKTVNGVDSTAGSTTPPNNVTKKPNNTSEHCINCTKTEDQNIFQHLLNNKPMLMRAFYVLLAVTSIVVVYFVMRAWRFVSKIYSNMTSFKRFESKPVVKLIYTYTHCNL